MCNDPCTDLSRKAGRSAINIWPWATQDSLSYIFSQISPRHLGAECPRLRQLLSVRTDSEISCTCDRSDPLYRRSLLTLNTEICDGKCSCPVVRSHADVKYFQISRVSAVIDEHQSSWEYPSDQDSELRRPLVVHLLMIYIDRNSASDLV